MEADKSIGSKESLITFLFFPLLKFHYFCRKFLTHGKRQKSKAIY